MKEPPVRHIFSVHVARQAVRLDQTVSVLARTFGLEPAEGGDLDAGLEAVCVEGIAA